MQCWYDYSQRHDRVDGWVAYDDIWRLNGFANCPHERSGNEDRPRVDSLPPSWCPYAAEHVVSNETEEGNL